MVYQMLCEGFCVTCCHRLHLQEGSRRCTRDWMDIVAFHGHVLCVVNRFGVIKGEPKVDCLFDVRAQLSNENLQILSIRAKHY